MARTGRLRRQAKAVLEKPFSVSLFRGRQEANLAMTALTNWAGPKRRCSELRDLQPDALSGRGWLSADAVSVLRKTDRLGILHPRPGEVGADVAAGDFEIFSVRVPEGPPYPWHEDWRYGYFWDPQHFQDFDFYAPAIRPEPFDIKFPWELNRLGFLLAVAELAAMHEKSLARDHIAEVIENWVAANPLGMSASWQPMEASMRAIALVTVVAMLERGGILERRFVSLLAPLIAQHGEFIWRTREFTDVRGNHYAANVVALLLCGELFRGTWKPADRWFDFGKEELEQEVELQFYGDGVNIEGSSAYHYLVSHLFFLGILAIERSTGESINARTDERMRRAFAYLAALVRPNGTFPSVGDDDSAMVASFTANRCPAAWDILIAGACRWKAPELLAPGVRLTTGAIWTSGAGAIELDWEQAPPVNRFFDQGGVVVVRTFGTYLHFDVGDVGLRGRGGHGHNDLGSFELCVAGAPFVVDPGSYLYTGDLLARDLFRSTSYHNTVVIDGQEMAPLKGHWMIDSCAAPEDVSWEAQEDQVVATVCHRGYERLDDPVRVRRELSLAFTSGALRCQDEVIAEGSHKIERFIHLAQEWRVEVETGLARCTYEGRVIEVHFDQHSTLRVVEGWVSSGYGRRSVAPVLVATCLGRGRCSLWFTIAPAYASTDVNES